MNRSKKQTTVAKRNNKTNYDFVEHREILDQRLEELTKKCKITHNYKKLGVVFLILIRNKLEEIGTNLFLRSSDGPSYKYMGLINDFLRANFEFRLFSDELMIRLKGIESQLSKREEVGLQKIKEVMDLYYHIRDIKVPNLLEEDADINGFQSSPPSFHSYALFRSIFQPDSKKDIHQLNSLLLQKVKQKEAQLQRQLKEQYDEHSFQTMLSVKKTIHSLKYPDKKQILNGPLHQNISYQSSISKLIPFTFAGAGVLFLGLAIVLIIQAVMLPVTTSLSMLTALFGGVGGLILLVYWLKFREI